MLPKPLCVKCGNEMTPENAKIHPEYFLHDDCLSEELNDKIKFKIGFMAGWQHANYSAANLEQLFEVWYAAKDNQSLRDCRCDKCKHVWSTTQYPSVCPKCDTVWH